MATMMPTSVDDEVVDRRPDTRPVGRTRAFFAALWRSKTGFAGFWIFLFICLMGLFGPYIVTPDKVANEDLIFTTPSWDHLLGTDSEGKDILKQIIAGGQDVIVVGLVSSLISTFIAVAFGALAAYVRGWIDSLVIQVTDFFLTIPVFAVLIVLSGSLRLDSAFLLAVLLGLFGWPGLLRAVRAQVLSLKEREYVEAARLVDLGTTRILFREILPNMASYLMIHFIIGMTSAVYALAGLYLLGLAPMSGTNWGIMINQGWIKAVFYNTDSMSYILSPLAVISLLQLSSIWLVRSLEEIINPRLRGEG